MVRYGGSLKSKVKRWLDECRLAFSGIVLATRSQSFLLGFVISFIIFGTLMNLLASSAASLSLFWVTDFGGKVDIVWRAFIGIFGFGRNFWDWLLLFVVTLLQSILIGLVVLVWQKRRRNKKAQIAASAANANNVQHASIAAGLAVLGSGCPTCGTTLLMPLLGTLFSTSSYILASVISGLLTAFAIILALWSIKRLGNDAYVMITSEKFLQRKAKTSSTPSKSISSGEKS